MSFATLYDSLSLQEPVSIMSLLENPNIYPAEKNSLFHQFLMSLSGLNTNKMKTEIVI